MKKHWPFFLVLGIAFWAAWPLLTPGFIPTHDGEYHLIRFFEFDKNIRAGNFFPRWAPGLNAGYGVPLFNFFYPLPNYLAEFFHWLGFSFIESFKLILALSLFAGAIFFYLWTRKRYGSKASAVGAIFYTLAPYHLLDVYVRGSVGEALALALFPVVLWLAEKRSFWAVFALALLILSHNLLALIFLLFLISYFIFRQFKLFYSIVFFLYGFGLSAFFWLPALGEAKHVVGLKMINFADHFPSFWQLILPSWGTGFSQPGFGDNLSFQIGLPHFLAVLAGLIIWRRSKNRLSFWLTWFFVIFLMLLKTSEPIWRLVPGLDLVQYPWRLLSLMILVTSAFATILASKSKQLALVLAGLALVFYPGYARPVKYTPRTDDFYLKNPVWTKGTATLGNSFKTVWLANQNLAPAEKKLEAVEGEIEIAEEVIRPTWYRFTFRAKTPSQLKINTAYFPGWRVWLNDQQPPVVINYQDGLINFPVAAGDHSLLVKFVNTPVRQLANGISLASLLLVGAAGIIKSAKKYESIS